MKNLPPILLFLALLTSTDAFAKSCKQKWSEYYAGKSWFKSFCNTEEYKHRQRAKKSTKTITYMMVNQSNLGGKNLLQS
jgi:hypothetical protein